VTKRTWTQEQVDDIVHMYTVQRCTQKVIAAKYSAKVQTISGILKAHNVSINYRKGANRHMNDQYFDVVDSAEKAYFLGLLLTDGSVIYDAERIRQPEISIELIESDVEILHRLRDAIGLSTKLCYAKRAGRKHGTYTLKFRSAHMASTLAAYHIVQDKTHRVRVLPQNIPEQYMKDYVRGLIDGDGSIYFSQGSWHINYCGHFQSLVRDVGNVCCSMIGRDAPLKIQVSDNVYRITFNGAWAQKLASALYDNADIAIARKYRLAIAAMRG